MKILSLTLGVVVPNLGEKPQIYAGYRGVMVPRGGLRQQNNINDLTKRLGTFLRIGAQGIASYCPQPLGRRICLTPYSLKTAAREAGEKRLAKRARSTPIFNTNNWLFVPADRASANALE